MQPFTIIGSNHPKQLRQDQFTYKITHPFKIKSNLITQPNPNIVNSSNSQIGINKLVDYDVSANKKPVTNHIININKGKIRGFKVDLKNPEKNSNNNFVYASEKGNQVKQYQKIKLNDVVVEENNTIKFVQQIPKQHILINPKKDDSQYHNNIEQKQSKRKQIFNSNSQLKDQYTPVNQLNSKNNSNYIASHSHEDPPKIIAFNPNHSNQQSFKISENKSLQISLQSQNKKIIKAAHRHPLFTNQNAQYFEDSSYSLVNKSIPKTIQIKQTPINQLEESHVQPFINYQPKTIKQYQIKQPKEHRDVKISQQSASLSFGQLEQSQGISSNTFGKINSKQNQNNRVEMKKQPRNQTSIS